MKYNKIARKKIVGKERKINCTQSLIRMKVTQETSTGDVLMKQKRKSRNEGK